MGRLSRALHDRGWQTLRGIAQWARYAQTLSLARAALHLVRELAGDGRRRDRQPRRARTLGLSAIAGVTEKAGRSHVCRVRPPLRRRHRYALDAARRAQG